MNKISLQYEDIFHRSKNLLHMLKALFSSMTRVKLLNLFLLSSPESSFFVRELTRLLDEQINSIRRELENLENIGLLRSFSQNRKKYYQVNPQFPILQELKSIFRKNQSAYNEILSRIQSFGDTKLILINGNFVGEESNVDLLVVGEIDKAALSGYLTTELSYQYDHEIRYSVLSEEDFLYRVGIRDAFALRLVMSEKSIFLENKISAKLDELV